MVASCNIQIPISLTKLSLSDHSPFIFYEPEMFGSAIYKMKEPKCTIMIFRNGKIIFLGANKYEPINKAFEKIVPLLFKHKFKKKKITDN